MLPVFLPYVALLNAAFSQDRDLVAPVDNCTLHNFDFVFFELSATRLALKNTFMLGALAATIGTMLALVDRLSHDAQRDPRPSRCSASSPPRRSRSPASCSASACS